MPSSTAKSPDAAQGDAYAALRPRLFGIAYRMLGTRADADDVLQDAWVRWHQTDATQLRSAEAWLVTVVTRLSIDRLRAAKIEREAYVGWWLPEPMVQIDSHTPEAAAEHAGDVSIALLWVLERLAPEERAAYLLHEMFDQDYADIAALLDKSESACRQLVHRATKRVKQEHPRFDVPQHTHRALLERFVRAARSGEREAIKALLGDDVEVIGDGGGKVPTVHKVLRGADRVANLYWSLSRRAAMQVEYRIVLVNGEPGLLRFIDGQLESAQAVVTDGLRITAIYTVRNPDKLARIRGLSQT